MTDRLRRCEARLPREQGGHRCRKHLYHLTETSTSETGTELPGATAGEKHRAFGKEWS